MPTTECMIEALVDLRNRPPEVQPDQFWRLVNRFRAGLVHQALAILGNQQDAEDVAQETLCSAFLELGSLRDPARLGAWLRSINRCKALSLRRRRTRAREQRLTTGQQEALQDRAQATPTALQRQAEGAAAILRAVDGLPEHYREVVVLRHVEKLAADQIAQRLNLKPGTVRIRLMRANRLLAGKLRVK